MHKYIISHWLWAIQIIEFVEKKKFEKEEVLGQKRCKGYYMLLKGAHQKAAVKKILSIDEHELAMAEMMSYNTKVSWAKWAHI